VVHSDKDCAANVLASSPAALMRVDFSCSSAAFNPARKPSTASGFTYTASLRRPTPIKFRQHFGGEKFDPNQRGRGSNWARWNKP
jgi:hypothetical protein